MPTVKLSYKGSVTPKSTSFLTPQKFDMGFEADYDADESDAAILKTLQKEFQSAMEDNVKKQVAHLDKWLTEKNALIADLVKGAEALKGSFPDDPGKASAFTAKASTLAKSATQIKALEEDYRKIVSDWADNCREQQAQVAIVTAIKKARVKTFQQKNFRVKAGLAIKAIIVVAVIALSVAAIVMSCGSMAPVVVGLAAAGIALSGVSSLGAIGKNIATNIDTEKKLLNNIKTDIEGVRAAMTGVSEKGSKIAKHVTELQNVIKIKEDQIRAIENDSRKYLVDANKFKGELAKLKALGASEVLDAKKLATKQKGSDEINAKLTKLATQVGTLKADILKSKELLKQLQDLGVDIAKVSGQAPNSVLGNLKDRFTSVDGWLDAAGTAGSLVGGAAYVI